MRWLRTTGTSNRDGYRMPREVVDKFDSFRWVGVRGHWNGYRTHYAPVYRVLMTDGASIDYNAAPWQNGGGAEWRWRVRS